MTLDEAIKRAEKVAEDEERNAGWFYDKESANYKKKCVKCAEEHRQLVEWLKNYKWLLTQGPCEDAISRQSAIFLANDLKQDLPDDEHLADIVMAHNEGVSEYQTQLSLLPPVNPQSKTGHWIDTDEGFSPCKCSECETVEFKKSKYCPNCGAKMQEIEE